MAVRVEDSSTMAFHAEIMRWRNDHVAHRLSRDFEDIVALAH
jgi:hypothetical protein